MCYYISLKEKNKKNKEKKKKKSCHDSVINASWIVYIIGAEDNRRRKGGAVIDQERKRQIKGSFILRVGDDLLLLVKFLIFMGFFLHPRQFLRPIIYIDLRDFQAESASRGGAFFLDTLAVCV